MPSFPRRDPATGPPLFSSWRGVFLDSDDGKVSEPEVGRLNSQLGALVQRLNGGVSLGNGVHQTRAGCLDANYLDVRFPAVVTETPVVHGLGRRPVGYLVVRRAVEVEVYDSNPAKWTPEIMYLEANGATFPTTVKLLVW